MVRHTVVEFEFIVSDASLCPYDGPRPKNVHIIHEFPRLGHTKGYNAAFERCQGEYILWLNDDAEVTEGYDVNALDFMKANPQIGLGALHYSEPSNGLPFHVNSAWETMYANFGIFKRELGCHVGFFDEDLEMYGADNSLAIRILLAGYGIADIPNAKIIHHSESDQLRHDNQIVRAHDNKVLNRKYMPLWQIWRTTYRKYAKESSVPWSHGREPVTR